MSSLPPIAKAQSQIQQIPPPSIIPGTFHSILPNIEDVLVTVQELTRGGNVIGSVEASEAIVEKAKELSDCLERMKRAALTLPGGHLSTEEIRELDLLLDGEAEKRRRILETFSTSPLPHTSGLVAQKMHGASSDEVNGDEDLAAGGTSVMPSPTAAGLMIDDGGMKEE